MSREAFPIRESDLLPLSLGAAVLGTGGGGNPYIGMLRLRELLRAGYSVEVLPLEALKDVGYSEDVIFEQTVSVAVAAGLERLEAGLEVLP